MIYDTIDNISTYAGISPRLYEGLKAIRDTDFSLLADGHYELDGDLLYMNVMTVETKINDRPEAHRKYIDIQYVISGEERIGVAPLENMECEIESNPDGDIWFYQGSTDKVYLGGKRFVVLFPQDAHAPCYVCGEVASVRKVVVKVACD